MAAHPKVPRRFYERNALEVAKDLLGCYLVRQSEEGRTIGRIVEDEAYMGISDKASHVYGGRRTKRNEVMWGPAGHAYIYLIYGMYYCLNTVTQPQGIPQAVLIRALEPVEGIDLMAKRRGFDEISSRTRIQLCNGPGKLCMAMGIDRSLNGIDLTGDVLFVESREDRDFEIISAPRVNVDYAGEDALRPWRFFIKGNKFVSKAGK